LAKKVSEKISAAGVDLLSLYGQHDSNLEALAKKFDVKIVARGEEITLEGERAEVTKASNALRGLMLLVEKNHRISDIDLLNVIESSERMAPGEPERGDVILSTRGGAIRPKTPGQERYVAAIEEYDIVFGIGPAGTGKTYLAVEKAVAALKRHEISRIVLARPAVEAGESLGFLPGDLMEKVNPYLAPLYDALRDMLTAERLRHLLDVKTIEVIPLAFMRGRTINHAYVILDEAQNTTAMQMKMFLTRLGVNSKAIITGDITQVDLPDKKTSGLIQIQEILSGIEGIKFVYLTKKDVVRHKLVQEIVKAYELYENRVGKGRKAPGEGEKGSGEA